MVFESEHHLHTPSTPSPSAASLTDLANCQSQSRLGRTMVMKCVNPARGSGRRFLFVGSTSKIEQNTLGVQCVEIQLLDSRELKIVLTRSKLLCFCDKKSLDDLL